MNQHMHQNQAMGGNPMGGQMGPTGQMQGSQMPMHSSMPGHMGGGELHLYIMLR